MSRHAATASTDPGRVSPKVRWAAILTGVLTALGTALVPALQAIPPEAFEDLGPWAVPASLLTGGAAATIAAYVRSDPARAQQVPQVDSPRETGDYASNLVDPGSLVLTEDQALTGLEDTDPVARLAGQVGA